MSDKKHHEPVEADVVERAKGFWEKYSKTILVISGDSDPRTPSRLAGLGVSEGWHCLEVGFGAGGVALWLAGQDARWAAIRIGW